MDTHFRDMSTDLLRSGYGIRFRATGHSMQPTIEDGDVITVASITPTAVKRGDILLYQSECGVQAYRVVRINQAQGHPEHVLRGDASVTCADPVEAKHVLGRVVSADPALLFPRPNSICLDRKLPSFNGGEARAL